MAELIAEAEFMGKRQTLEQQTQRLKIATEVAKSKARVKLLENTREINGKVDTASTFTVYPAKGNTSIAEKGICQGDNPKRSGNADKGEVIYNDSYQEYETKPHQFIDEKIVGAEAKSVRKVERRSVDRDANRNLSDTTSSTREPTGILC